MFPRAYEIFRDDIVTLDPDRYPPSYVDKQVLVGAWRCWGSDRACILAEIRVYPSGVRELHGVAAAGDLHEIAKLIPMAERWGQSLGCVRAVIESRPGWDRVLPGYEVHQVAVRKEL